MNDTKSIRTTRFCLDPLKAEHAELMFNGLSDPGSYAFIPEDAPANVAVLAARYERLETQLSPGGKEVWLNWVIASQDQQELFGYVQFTIKREERRAFVAYFVFPDHTKRGIAAEAVAAALSHVMQNYLIDEVNAEMDTRNVASIALVESLGFVRMRLVPHADEFKGAVSDEYHYAYRGHQMNQTHQAAPQNIYDDTTFFEGYKALRDGDTGLNGTLEIPALHQLLPAVSNLHVLDLGCGFGEFARFARAQGAASVTGVDISARMLEEAALRTSDPAVSYVHHPIETYAPSPQRFDLVVSSLALHYIENYADLVQRVYQALKPGGCLLFSVEHPICTAYPAGWVKDDEGRKQYWPVDHYREEGRRDTKWFVDGVIKYHRTVETYVNTLIRAGFMLDYLGEPAPAAQVLAVRPALESDCRRPPFLFLRAVRPVR